MGRFDYLCECEGRICRHTGGQNDESEVIIEVPLVGGKNVYLLGRYECYGYVTVSYKNLRYQFYPEQFKEFFEDWLETESEEVRKNIFIAKRIWTDSEPNKYGDILNTDCFDLSCNITDVTPEIIERCIRADNNINLPSDLEKKRNRINSLTKQIKCLQDELNHLTNELNTLKGECP